MKLAGCANITAHPIVVIKMVTATQKGVNDTENKNKMAERAGFEPARGVNPYAISSRAHSSTLAPLRGGLDVPNVPEPCRTASGGRRL